MCSRAIFLGRRRSGWEFYSRKIIEFLPFGLSISNRKEVERERKVSVVSMVGGSKRARVSISYIFRFKVSRVR